MGSVADTQGEQFDEVEGEVHDGGALKYLPLPQSSNATTISGAGSVDDAGSPDEDHEADPQYQKNGKEVLVRKYPLFQRRLTDF